MYKKYARRPEVYKAIQWTGENKQDIIDLIGDKAVLIEVYSNDGKVISSNLVVSVKRKNKDGIEKEIFHREVKIGDYISVNAYNKVRVYTKSAFERIYMVINDEPELMEVKEDINNENA